MPKARQVFANIMVIRTHYQQHFTKHEQQQKARKQLFDCDIEIYSAFLLTLYRLYQANKINPEICNQYNDRIFNHVNSLLAFNRFTKGVYRQQFMLLLKAITRLGNTTLKQAKPDARTDLTKACIQALWLADCLTEKRFVPANHKLKIELLIINLNAATNYALKPLLLKNVLRLSSATDNMIRAYQKSDFLIFPENRAFNCYLTGIIALLLTAATITLVTALSASMLPIAIILFITTISLPFLASLYMSSKLYYPEEDKAHCLRASLLGFFADRNIAKTAQLALPSLKPAAPVKQEKKLKTPTWKY